MTSTQSDERRPASRSRVTVLATIAVLAVLVVLFFVFASLYTDWLWFQQLGFLNVLTTQWVASTVMFFIGFFGIYRTSRNFQLHIRDRNDTKRKNLCTRGMCLVRRVA